MLAAALHVFDVAASLRSPVIAWSAGAMALTDRIVLFHDRAPQGPGHPELYGRGLSVLSGVVALPHARRAAAARRPATDGRLRPQVRTCPLYAPGEGTRVDPTRTAARVRRGTRVLAEDGRVTSRGAA